MVSDPDADSKSAGGHGDVADAAESVGENGSENETDRRTLSRRTLLGGAVLAGVGVAGATTLLGGDDVPGVGGDRPPRQTTPVESEEAQTLAEQFAPTLYFGKRERWFPTDPRPYTSEVDGETVVDGFDALDGYTAAQKAGDTLAPDPTVFYRVVEYTDELAVVQYWIYSAFDQFSVNFHWHDWELLQAFVDRETGEAALYVASAHSRQVPNNEFIDPSARPAIISEVGSHSSALGMNERRDTFQRLPIDGLAADVTNGVIAVASGEEAVPLAYGLPRDEGFRLPYVLPELDGAPLADHPKLPNVSTEDLIAGDIAVRSFSDLTRPPTSIPTRERGLVFDAASVADGEADETYTLVPASEVEDIAAFTGPQLSFEFQVPGFVEDAVASHITSTDPPWEQPRYTDPLVDVTDGDHRSTIIERFALDEGSRGETVVGRVSELQPVDDIDVGVTLATPGVEAVAQLASDPVAVPTFGGVAAFVDVEPGEHTLTVNGPGYAPYAQEVRVGSAATSASTSTETPTATATARTAETTTESRSETPQASTPAGDAVRLGSGGRIGLVPSEDAVKLQVDAAERGGVRRVRVDDDAAGRVFDAPPVENDDGAAAIYVHRAGGYVVEVTDRQGGRSVERVNPGPNQNAAEVAKARTGTAGVTRFLVEYLEETRETVRRLLEKGGDRSSNSGQQGGQAETPRALDAATPTAESAETFEQTDGDDEEDPTREPTATATPTPTPTPEPTAEPTPESEATATPTADGDGGGGGTGTRTPTADGQGGSGTDRLLELLDEAVALARRANEAATSGDRETTQETLRALRDVFATIVSLTEEGSLPQNVARITRRRIETADRRAERVVSE